MLYLHIPFCKQACSYCNFHFSTRLEGKAAVLRAMVRELGERRGELPPGPVETVYFGGGTPSVLDASKLNLLFDAIETNGYSTRDRAQEITLEANPDDLTPDTIARLHDSPVNRLSIGVQSFFDKDLQFMNRAHDARQALQALERVRRAGFDNVSIDLIYGGQTTTDAMWQRNLELTTELGVQHVAAYALTVEPRTALGHWVSTGRVADTDDERFARQFDMLTDRLTAAGYEHYEISNFARPGRRSRHNSGYWTGRPYLGIGPGAHSFDGQRRRRWNVSNNALYVKGQPPEEEVLSDDDRYNEYVMTALRRAEGVDAQELERRFGAGRRAYFEGEIGESIAVGYVRKERENYRLTREGLRVADGVAAGVFC